MPGTRKRKSRAGNGDGAASDQKRCKIALPGSARENIIKSALLAQFYPKVLTLREYLLHKLPQHSKVRKRKIRNVGKGDSVDGEFATFLDQTLVGIRQAEAPSSDERLKSWNAFSQRNDESISTLANLTGVGRFSQSEVVDFTIWQLFSKCNNTNVKPNHLLCQGFRRDTSHRNDGIPSAIPGLSSVYPNSHVTSLKAIPWPRVLTLWGNEGEKAMAELLLDCGIFVPVIESQGVYSQLSGQPLGELKSLINNDQALLEDLSRSNLQRTGRKPLEIVFVRNRMLYARAALNAHGGVRFGFRHIHVLNRYPAGKIVQHEQSHRINKSTALHPDTVHLMLYMFPRQFGLHNAFTSEVDTRQTVQSFQDYTLREDEISKRFPGQPKLPKRLRGKALALTRSMQIRHSRCSYKQLIDYYCPVVASRGNTLPSAPASTMLTSKTIKTQLTLTTGASGTINSTLSPGTKMIFPPKQSMTDHATPSSSVAAFCIAALSYLIPNEFWGSGETQKHNLRVFHRNIGHFIKLRRFESLSLHEVTQGLKIGNIEWLGLLDNDRKMAQSDTKKRWELFHEFIYYLFDSLLIPLVRSNFHVTESNVHRYRLFYFRHDVWKSIAEPALASLKLSMFEEVKLHKALQILDGRKLGFSQIRLLPKENGIRPIINLRRRTIKKGTDILGTSINSLLAPVYNVLTYEKSLDLNRLGATLFSVGDLYAKLKTFKSQHDAFSPLYFAKLDVQAAFDTIPQSAVINLMHSLSSEEEYRISKHMEIKPGEDFRHNVKSKPSRKWTALAHASDNLDTFDEVLVSELATGRKNTIFVENVVSQFRSSREIFSLLEEHVHNNMVKIGKRFYRQKEGIPQGSVLSSLLCNYFYADLEQKHLSFLKTGDSLLLRLIDDFLLITINPDHAKKFLKIMHKGVPEYGVCVNPEKTLVNFEVAINGKKVPRLVGEKNFPYCGSFVDTKTLEIRRDRERRKEMDLSDSLTVEYSRNPGKTFHRKVLNAFKIQAHAMFLDTSFNTIQTVLYNIYTAFVETAEKTWTYARCLPVGKQPGTDLMIKTITDLTALAFVLIKSKGKTKKNAGFKCAVSKVQLEWLVLNAFRKVLGRRQSRYGKVLAWIEGRIGIINAKGADVCRRLNGVLQKADQIGVD